MTISQYILDTTLRDGEQGVGIALSVENKCAIHEKLFQLGIRQFELGCPVMGGQEKEAIQEVCRRDKSSELSVWCRALEKDVLSALETPAHIIHISFPTSPLQRKVWGWDHLRCYEALKQLSSLVLSAGRQLSVGAQDASRESLENLLAFGRKAHQFGAMRWRIADTVGCWSPLQVQRHIAMLKAELTELKIDFHGHNDLGMATANALTALQSGAEQVSVTVAGIGERAGNAALEEVMVALAQHRDESEACDVHLALLTSCCHFVSEIMGRTIPDHKAIVGDKIFETESGIHCAGLCADRESYFAFSSEIVGGKESAFVLGKHSGRQGLRKVLQNMGILCTHAFEGPLLEKIQNFTIQNHRSPSEIELHQMLFHIRSHHGVSCLSS